MQFLQTLAIRDHLEKYGELDKKYKLDEFDKIIAMPGVLMRVQLEITKGKLCLIFMLDSKTFEVMLLFMSKQTRTLQAILDLFNPV